MTILWLSWPGKFRQIFPFFEQDARIFTVFLSNSFLIYRLITRIKLANLPHFPRQPVKQPHKKRIKYVFSQEQNDLKMPAGNGLCPGKSLPAHRQSPKHSGSSGQFLRPVSYRLHLQHRPEDAAQKTAHASQRQGGLGVMWNVDDGLVQIKFNGLIPSDRSPA